MSDMMKIVKELGAANAVKTVEIERLRAENERLTREKDDAGVGACAGCGSTETIEAIRRTHPAALACCPERNMLSAKEWHDRGEAAEAKVVKLREVLHPFVNLTTARFMTNGCKYGFRIDVAVIRAARVVYVETEESND
jgi:hypothetical protein